MLEHSLLANAMLRELKVHCRFGLSDRGNGSWYYQETPGKCDAVLHLNEVAGHEKVCPMARVKCPVPGCGTIVKREYLASHMMREAMSHVELLMAVNEQLQDQLVFERGRLVEKTCRLQEAQAQVEILENEHEEKRACLLLQSIAEGNNSIEKNLTMTSLLHDWGVGTENNRQNVGAAPPPKKTKTGTKVRVVLSFCLLEAESGGGFLCRP